MKLAKAIAALAVLVAVTFDPSAAAAPAPNVPVYAYFYQWFNTSSWDRAKADIPLAGRYSSDDAHLLRDQVQQARGAGIDGFLTSWKSTPTLNRRLELLVRVAAAEHFGIGVVYEALDFTRRPLPVNKIRSDLLYLLRRWGSDLRSDRFARPLIVWTGTDQYSLDAVRSVRAALGNRAYLLAASRSVDGYERLARLVDGEAYYWSSANPDSRSTSGKLTEMSKAVHARHGIWIAPAAPGFDGRTLGHHRVIARHDGRTLRRSLENASATAPDAIGLISWNEWSENTYIEPGHRYGARELTLLRNYLLPHAANAGQTPTQSSSTGFWSGLRAGMALLLVTVVGAVFLAWRVRRGARRPARPGDESTPGRPRPTDLMLESPPDEPISTTGRTPP
jgi:hypothetical protein